MQAHKKIEQELQAEYGNMSVGKNFIGLLVVLVVIGGPLIGVVALFNAEMNKGGAAKEHNPTVAETRAATNSCSQLLDVPTYVIQDWSFSQRREAIRFVRMLNNAEYLNYEHGLILPHFMKNYARLNQ